MPNAACRIAVACCVALIPAVSVGAFQDVSTRARGLEHGYNLDYPEALAAFQEAIAADPNDAIAHRLAAATIWMQILFQQGAVTVEDYLGQARGNVERHPPAPSLAAAFRHHADRAVALAEQRVRSHPTDPDARFQLGAAAGVAASYTATVEGRVLDSVGAARRAYGEQKRSMSIDPSRKDAGLIVGLYQYGISSLSLPLRLMARIAGFQSGRERGLRLVEEAAGYPSYVQTNAQFSLVLIYNREGRYDDALRVIRELQVRYPRNRLLWLEAAGTALRAGRAAVAREAIDAGLARLASDGRPRAFGEDARWRYHRGTALVALGQLEAARRELDAVVTLPAHAWVRGRARLELGKVADLTHDRATAMSSYRLAFQDCRSGHDSACADEAKRLVATRYRQ
jgi:tetratricopeptide (TPR) repeat protein